MCYGTGGSVGAGTYSFIAPGKKPRRKLRVRREKAGVHHVARRCGGDVADCRAGAAGNDTRSTDRVVGHRLSRVVPLFPGCFSGWSKGVELSGRTKHKD